MLRVTTLTGTVGLRDKTVEGLVTSLSGRLLLPHDEEYDQARAVWNRMVDRKPALIVRCAGDGDVIRSVRFAREHDLLMSVRGGGHNVSGNAVCDGGIMIDLSLMKGTAIDAERRVVRAEAGLNWGELDTATQRSGLATTGGFVSTTGVAGLTLGGGHGWLMRRHGLACDALLSADIVTADGLRLRASSEENPDLFWGIRGGGGNFGVVTSFEFQLHPLDKVVGGVVLYPMDRAREILGLYREFVGGAPDELTAHVLITTWFDGNPVIAIGVCYCGPPEVGDRVLQPIRKLGSPILDNIGPRDYTELQAMFDATNPPGNWYYKSGYFDSTRVKDNHFIDVLLEHCDFPSPSPLSRIAIEQLGGAMARVDPQDTAFNHRGAPFSLLVIAGGFEPEAAEDNIRWARGTWDAMRPFLSDGVYVNYLGADEGAERIKGAYGQGYDRLVALKARYDPENRFRLNQNIVPG